MGGKGALALSSCFGCKLTDEMMLPLGGDIIGVCEILSSASKAVFPRPCLRPASKYHMKGGVSQVMTWYFQSNGVCVPPKCEMQIVIIVVVMFTVIPFKGGEGRSSNRPNSGACSIELLSPLNLSFIAFIALIGKGGEIERMV
jgi:hypothetical protein